MSKRRLDGRIERTPGNSRMHCLREITVTYEGQNERTVVKAPDLSVNGMFISTSRRFPEGAVLNLQFRMAVTNAVVQTRCEVRYCLPGVGVEFIGIAPEAKKDIERELKLALESVQGGAARRVARPRATRRR
ncbi:MAG: PilZ domain-containing protein [Candidatus Acidiferrales bacterium]